MAGPWDSYAPTAAPGPWQAYRAVDTLTAPQPNAPHGIINAIISGLESSATGLIIRGELPSQQLPADSTWGERAAAGIAGVIADIPESVLGILGGGAAGTAVAPGLGTAVGGGAGAVAVPSAIREALMTAYAQGGINSWSDAWEVVKSALEGGGKGAVVGGLTAGAGRAVGGVLAKSTPAIRVVAKTSAEIATLTTAGAALEGRLPTAQEFLDGAVVVGGIHGAAKIAGGLRNIYARTGVLPADVALAAIKDPELKAEIISNPTALPKAFEARALGESVKAAVPEVADRATAARFAESPFAPIGQAKGEPTRPTHINYNYVNGEAELSGTLARLSNLYEGKIQAARRGVISIEQTIAESKRELASILGVASDKLPGEAGVPIDKLGARLLAKRQLAVDAAQELKAQGKALAEIGAGATEAQVAQFLAHAERSSMILADFLGMRAEVARAQNALKSSVSASMDLSAVQKLLEGHGGKDKVMNFARIMADADNPASVLRAAQAMVKPSSLEKSIEVWKASILSGPTTHLANLMGNLSSTVMKFPERLTAAAIGKLHGGEKVTVSEVRALAGGMIGGSLDALKLAGQAAGDALRLKESPVDPSKTEQYRAAVGGKTGEFVRIPFKMLTAEDALFRTLNERGEINALAVRQVIKDGFTPGTREFNTRVIDLIQNPSEALAKAVTAAGDKSVFTTKLGKTGTHLQMMVKGTPLEFILPFIKTPANLLKWAAEYVPGVNLLMSSVRADLSGKNGAAARDLAAARMLIGGVVATVVFDAVENDVITGGGLSDPEKRRAKVAAGWQPYSIKIGDTYYSYQRIDPVARLLATAADAAEIYAAAGENDKLNLAGAITSAVGNATISQTYLSGLSSAVNAITDPNRYGGRWLDRYAASLVPSIVGQTAAEIDPNAREVNSILDAIQSRIPFWREQLLPVRNPLTGNPVEGKDRVFPFAPITATDASADKVLSEAMRLGVSLPIAPRNVQVGRGTGKLGKVEIDAQARNAFTQKQGEFAHEILSQIVNTPAWDAIPDIVKTDVYSKIITAARTQAALVALPPEARSAEVTRIADELAQKLVK